MEIYLITILALVSLAIIYYINKIEGELQGLKERYNMLVEFNKKLTKKVKGNSNETI